MAEGEKPKAEEKKAEKTEKEFTDLQLDKALQVVGEKLEAPLAKK